MNCINKMRRSKRIVNDHHEKVISIYQSHV